MSERGPNWIQTWSGRPFWPLAAQPDDIDPRDIAAHLSKLCRFGGACREFYSVAEHSVLLSRLVPQEDALWGLLHDAAEAYLGDMVRPLKRLPQLWAYREAEQQILQAIAVKFDLPPDLPASVKAADDRLLATEARELMAPPPARWAALDAEPYELPEGLECLDWRAAGSAFMDRYRELTT